MLSPLTRINLSSECSQLQPADDSLIITIHTKPALLGGVVVRTPDWRLSVAGSSPGRNTARLFFWDRWPCLAGKLSWDITTTYSQLNFVSLLGGLIEYQLRLRKRRESHRYRVAGNTVWSHIACDLEQQCNDFHELLYIRFTLHTQSSSSV